MTGVVRKTVLLGACWLSATAVAFAQGPGVHYLHHGNMPPGAIGQGQLLRGGPVVGYYQPVEIKAPAGALISLAVADQFTEARRAPVRAGFLLAQVYRLRVTNVPQNDGAEVFPTIEVVDRLYPPPGQERRFPIIVELTREDLELAISGKFVTRIVYVEDPKMALPARLGGKPQNWYDVGPGRDPLAAADALGRPVAIVRMGARLPVADGTIEPQFFFGSPPFCEYPAEVKVLSRPPVREPQAAPPSEQPAEEVAPPTANRATTWTTPAAQTPVARRPLAQTTR